MFLTIMLRYLLYTQSQLSPTYTSRVTLLCCPGRISSRPLMTCGLVFPPPQALRGEGVGVGEEHLSFIHATIQQMRSRARSPIFMRVISNMTIIKRKKYLCFSLSAHFIYISHYPVGGNTIRSNFKLTPESSGLLNCTK